MKQDSVKTSADLVVYGKIFTSENNQIVEAFAVKDGKYVYVGDRGGGLFRQGPCDAFLW